MTREQKTEVSMLEEEQNMIASCSESLRRRINKSKNNKAKELFLMGVDLTESDLEPLEYFLSKNTSLKKLSLLLTELDEGLKAQLVKVLAQALKVNTSLEELWMYIQIGAQAITELASGLSENTSLREINFLIDNLEDIGVAKLAQALKGHKSLKKLQFHEMRVSTEAIRDLAQIIEENDVLEELWLHACYIDDEGATVLAQALMKNKSLRECSLYKNKVSNAGAIELAQVLKGNTSLEKFSLSGNYRINDAGRRAFVEALEDNWTLIEIEIEGMDNKTTFVRDKTKANGKFTVENFTVEDALERNQRIKAFRDPGKSVFHTIISRGTFGNKRPIPRSRSYDPVESTSNDVKPQIVP